VCLPSLRGACQLPGRRAQQWVPKDHFAFHRADHIGRLLKAATGFEPGMSHGGHDGTGGLIVARCGQPDREPPFRREPGELVGVQPAKPVRHGQRIRQLGRAGSLHRAEHPPALDQRQRISRRRPGQPTDDRGRIPRTEQSGRFLHGQSGQPKRVAVVDGDGRGRALPRGQQEADPVMS
jgi:hypothetical protein